jgi:hypothetical protein
VTKVISYQLSFPLCFPSTLSPETTLNYRSIRLAPTLTIRVDGLPWKFVVWPGLFASSELPFVVLDNCHRPRRQRYLRQPPRGGKGADLVQLASGLLRINSLCGRSRSRPCSTGSLTANTKSSHVL